MTTYDFGDIVLIGFPHTDMQGVFKRPALVLYDAGDLDVLVEFKEGANLIDLVGLALFLEEKLHMKVDVVPESALREEIRDIVLKEKVAV